MMSLYHTTVALLILQIYVSAAPTDVTEKGEQKLEKNPQPPPATLNKNVDDTQNQRQKRYYEHYGFPPLSPLPYPTYNKRDQSADLGVYGMAEDPLNGIHRRLQEIASVVKQAPPPPPPPIAPHLPLFFPVFFIPQLSCPCEPGNTQTTQKPQTPSSTETPTNGGTSPNIENRFPEMDDERQNWGLVADETEEEDDGEDFSRPISFDPITLNPSTSRPAPPVEHGSKQDGQAVGGPATTTTTTTTMKPAPASNEVSSPPASAAAPYPPSAQSPKQSPTSCDGAVLSCCHMPRVTYDCFAVLGCPDPTSYGNPCDPLVILRVVSKFQNFYGVKTG